MEGKRLQEYLTIVLDMEKQIYMEKQLESELLDRKNRLCVETFIKKPTIKKVDDIKSGHRCCLNLACIGCECSCCSCSIHAR